MFLWSLRYQNIDTFVIQYQKVFSTKNMITAEIHSKEHMIHVVDDLKQRNISTIYSNGIDMGIDLAFSPKFLYISQWITSLSIIQVCMNEKTGY